MSVRLFFVLGVLLLGTGCASLVGDEPPPPLPPEPKMVEAEFFDPYEFWVDQEAEDQWFEVLRSQRERLGVKSDGRTPREALKYKYVTSDRDGDRQLTKQEVQDAWNKEYSLFRRCIKSNGENGR